jgi:hypothetical protein
MDPAALATAHIGLEAIRRREATEASERPMRAHRRPRSTARAKIRTAIAAVLRSAADAIDVRQAEPARGS